MTGVGKRIEEAVKALEGGQLKKALYLTDKAGMERHHAVVEEAAKTCLADKDNKKACDQAMKQARDTLKDTITATLDDTGLEGVEEYLAPKQEEAPVVNESPAQQLEKEPDCVECHVADAVVKFVQICDNECSGESCAVMEPLLQDQATPPEKWLKTMREVASREGCGQEAYRQVLGELEGYLKEKGSPILKSEAKDG